MTRRCCVSLVPLLIAMATLSVVRPGHAETLVQQNVDTRVVLAFRVGQAALQALLPSGWKVEAVAAGPSKEANLFVTFIEQLLNQDAEGKLIAGGTTRIVAVGATAKHEQTAEVAPFLIRAFDANPQGIPGPYKGAVAATIRREASVQGTNLEQGTGSERWEMREGGGGVIELRFEFQRGVPTRAKIEGRPHSSVDPNFYRIYRIDQGTDVVKSVSAGVDRVRNYQFSMTVPELRSLFGGSEQLVSIAVQPWYVRQAFLP